MQASESPYICPECALPLEALGSELRCGAQHLWTLRNGVADLAWPRDIAPADDEDASEYDELMRWLFRVLRDDESSARLELVERLRLGEGMQVLEVACGTGLNYAPLIERIGTSGRVTGLDLSTPMLDAAAARITGENWPVELVRGNALRLPFPDGRFDAVLHAGTINRFNAKRAMAEMARVAKAGARVVVCDEGIAPWLRDTPYGRGVRALSNLFEAVPPIADIPPVAREVEIGWVGGSAFWFIAFTVSSVPELDIDAPMWGRSGTVGEYFRSLRG